MGRIFTVDPVEYRKELKRIEALAPVAFEFLKATALMLARRRR